VEAQFTTDGILKRDDLIVKKRGSVRPLSTWLLKRF